jgi:hypothetical protein
MIVHAANAGLRVAPVETAKYLSQAHDRVLTRLEEGFTIIINYLLLFFVACGGC